MSTYAWTDRTGRSYSYEPYVAEPIAAANITIGGDAVLALTSHLPHVLAYSLVDALAQSSASQDIFRFAAGGFRDFTRIASSDPAMWRDIAIANRAALLESIDMFSEHLGSLRQAVAAGDGAQLFATFTRAKQARDQFAALLAERG
ncbi:MAG: prephenate dehydrogenase/arogenate dehydrogenase family protein, partial [Acidimicrobiia bacterium]|nr:prephenate dehydrogenase/arogenate dehydrogenase family protein [Acidimicrobiia bacterium]